MVLWLHKSNRFPSSKPKCTVYAISWQVSHSVLFRYWFMKWIVKISDFFRKRCKSCGSDAKFGQYFARFNSIHNLFWGVQMINFGFIPYFQREIAQSFKFSNGYMKSKINFSNKRLIWSIVSKVFYSSSLFIKLN